ncbi:putative profilin, partial [Tanacetum coccineum]
MLTPNLHTPNLKIKYVTEKQREVFWPLVAWLMKVSQDDFKATGNGEVHDQGHVILQFYSLEICKRMLMFLKVRSSDSVKVVDAKEGD